MCQCRSQWGGKDCSQGKFNPFQTNGIFHKVTYNKVRIVHCIYLGVTGYNFQKYCISFFLMMDFVLANKADPDKRLHDAAFHLGLHYVCLPKYPKEKNNFRISQPKHMLWVLKRTCVKRPPKNRQNEDLYDKW